MRLVRMGARRWAQMRALSRGRLLQQLLPEQEGGEGEGPDYLPEGGGPRLLGEPACFSSCPRFAHHVKVPAFGEKLGATWEVEERMSEVWVASPACGDCEDAQGGPKLVQDVAFGFSLNPLERARIEDVLQDKVGAAPRDIANLEDVVLAELWAWRRLPVSLRPWVWVSRGFWSIEEMAGMNGILPAEVLQDEAEVTKLFSKVCALEEMPRVNPDLEKASGMEKHSAPLRVWLWSTKECASASLVPENAWTQLPTWIGSIIEGLLFRHAGTKCDLQARRVRENVCVYIYICEFSI